MKMTATNLWRRVCLVLCTFVLLMTVAFSPPVFATVLNGDADAVLGQPDAISNYPNVVSGSTFNQPYAVDKNGAVYVADYQNNRVLKWANGSALNNGQAADGVIGQADFTQGKANRGGSPNNNTLNKPCGIALWSTAVWVADCGNNRVLRFPNPQNLEATADIILGQANATSNSANSGGIGKNTLNYPTDVAINPDNADVWVADAGNSRVLKYTFAQLATGMEASRVVGQPDFTHNTYFDGQAYFGAQAGPDYKLGIDMSSYYSLGDLWVADYANNRVLKFNNPASDGPNASLVLGQTDFNAKQCNRGAGTYGNNASSMTLCYPLDVSVNSANGRVSVSDYYNSRVLRYNSPATNVGADLVLGQMNFASNLPDQGVARSETSLDMQKGISAWSTDADVWVADTANNRVLKFPSPGANGAAASLVLGQSIFTKAAANYVEARGFFYPYGVAIDKKRGRVFVADSSNNRVLWWNSITALVTRKPADGVLGQSDFSGNSVSYPATANSLRNPYSVTVDKDGNIWVADMLNSRVLRYNGATLITGCAANLVLGQADFSSYLKDRGGVVAANTVGYPAGVAVDESGNIWISDNSSHRVLKFTAASLANGVDASRVLGQANFTDNSSNRGGAVAANTLSSPYGIYCESTNIWVADANNNRVLKYTAPSTDGADAVRVLGQSAFNVNDGGLAQQNKLRGPRGVNVDGMGNVWVSEYATNRVVKFIPPLSDGMEAVLVLGQENFTSGDANRGGSVSTNTLQHPYGVATDNILNVYVADTDNHRVTIYNSGLAITALNPALSASAGATLTLAWDAAASGGYVAALFSDSDYLNLVPGSSGTQMGNSKTFTGLSANASYYFQVKVSTEIDIAYNLNRISALTAPPPGPNVSSLSPASGFNTATVQIAIRGSNFTLASTVKLSRTGQTDIAGAVTYTDASNLTASFDLSGALQGAWDLVVTVPGQQPFTGTGAFAVLAPTTAVEPVKVLQGIFNPARGDKSYIATHLAASGKVTVKVYDPGGRLVRDIFEGDRNSGDYSDEWDGRNKDGSKVASGVYLIRIEGPGFKTTKRVLVVK